MQYNIFGGEKDTTNQRKYAAFLTQKLPVFSSRWQSCWFRWHHKCRPLAVTKNAKQDRFVTTHCVD